MLFHSRTDVFEVVDVNIGGRSHVYIKCRFRYFLNISFKYEAKVRGNCHDFFMKALSFGRSCSCFCKC